jgi:glutamate decarboxylase
MLNLLINNIKAAWGGGLLMSEKYRKTRFFGVERADSLTWNPHKLLGALLQCSTFHLKVKVSHKK